MKNVTISQHPGKMPEIVDMQWNRNADNLSKQRPQVTVWNDQKVIKSDGLFRTNQLTDSSVYRLVSLDMKAVVQLDRHALPEISC